MGRKNNLVESKLLLNGLILIVKVLTFFYDIYSINKIIGNKFYFCIEIKYKK